MSCRYRGMSVYRGNVEFCNNGWGRQGVDISAAGGEVTSICEVKCGVAKTCKNRTIIRIPGRWMCRRRYGIDSK